MSGIIRDFSQQSVQELRSIIQKNAQDSQFGLFDWFEDTFLMQELNIQDYLNNVNDYHAKMIDKHNIGSTEFDKILERVHSVDTNYASRFSSLGDRVTALYTRIERLTEMINPSVIIADPSDFTKLADGIRSNYNKVKVESDTKIKQFEASMPVLYDKQWYENVADSVKSGLESAGQVAEGVGLGLVDIGKGFIQGPVDIAVGIYNSSQDFLSFCKNPNNKLTEWENYLGKHPFGIIQNYLNFEKELPSFLLNQANKSVDDFTKADLKTKSETATSFIGNIALLFIPGTIFTKIGKAGEALEVAENITKYEKADEIFNAGKTLAEEKAAIQAERAAELEQDFAQAERKREQAEIAIEKAKAAKEEEKAAKEAAKVAGTLKETSKAIKSVNITMSKIKATNVYSKTADEVNSFWKLNRYTNPPYQTNTIVKEFDLAQKTNFVRVYDGINSLKEGGWVMRAEDVAGLTAQQIKEKYALQYLPKYICDVEVDAGAKMHCGVAGEIADWGKGGGVQFDLNADRTVGNFTNQRSLP